MISYINLGFYRNWKSCGFYVMNSPAKIPVARNPIGIGRSNTNCLINCAHTDDYPSICPLKQP
jgi:hypothetical protein